LDEDGQFTDSGKYSKNGSFQPEWVATLHRNRWQLSTGMGGSFTPEYAQLLPLHLGVVLRLDERSVFGEKVEFHSVFVVV
jgi:hypothetical protein